MYEYNSFNYYIFIYIGFNFLLSNLFIIKLTREIILDDENYSIRCASSNGHFPMVKYLIESATGGLDDQERITLTRKMVLFSDFGKYNSFYNVCEKGHLDIQKYFIKVLSNLLSNLY